MRVKAWAPKPPGDEGFSSYDHTAFDGEDSNASEFYRNLDGSRKLG